jgi:hypothetical protein
MHKTNNLEDGYMGSGKLIRRAIQKYGVQNFTKEILHIFDNEDEMKTKEKEVVVINEMSYNLCEGGKGGFSYINTQVMTTDQRKENGQKGGMVSPGNRGKTNIGSSVWAKKHSPLLKQNVRKMGVLAAKEKDAIQKRKETYKRIGHQQGEKHSQYGTCWITDGSTNKKIKKEELDFWLDKGYYKGRIV